jgi:CDP-glycerol glycerophosphotransferase
MFDWSLTGKPLVLYAPDLARYRTTRDFYYDYESTMPVPVTTTQGGLEDAVRRAIDGAPFEYDDFVKRFSGRDDGQATMRVVDRIMELVRL